MLLFQVTRMLLRPMGEMCTRAESREKIQTDGRGVVPAVSAAPSFDGPRRSNGAATPFCPSLLAEDEAAATHCRPVPNRPQTPPTLLNLSLSFAFDATAFDSRNSTHPRIHPNAHQTTSFLFGRNTPPHTLPRTTSMHSKLHFLSDSFSSFHSFTCINFC